MAEFPTSPISPQQFMEEFVPAAAQDSSLAANAGDVEIKLGVQLNGEGGGEWLIRVADGELAVVSGSRAEAAFTIVQTVDDWRGALWEGRGGVFGEQAAALFQGGAAGGSKGNGPNTKAISQLAALDGLIRIVVKDGEGGDWSTGFKLGPGTIPADATTQVTISADDAKAMQSGALEPMQAFMSGRIQISGDMTLMMQMQAIAMSAGSGS